MHPKLTCPECGFKWYPKEFSIYTICPICFPPQEADKSSKIKTQNGITFSFAIKDEAKGLTYDGKIISPTK